MVDSLFWGRYTRVPEPDALTIFINTLSLICNRPLGIYSDYLHFIWFSWAYPCLLLHKKSPRIRSVNIINYSCGVCHKWILVMSHNGWAFKLPLIPLNCDCTLHFTIKLECKKIIDYFCNCNFLYDLFSRFLYHLFNLSFCISTTFCSSISY